MSAIKITPDERQAILDTRPRYGGTRSRDEKAANAEVFRRIKAKYGIPSNRKLKVEIDAVYNPDFCVLKDKETGETLTQVGARASAPVRTAAPKSLEPQAQWPYPTGSDKLDPVVAGPVPSAAPIGEFKVASINLQDALELLRAEGDMCDSHAKSTKQMTGNLMIEGGRLYFVS